MELLYSIPVNRATDRCFYRYRGIEIMHDTTLGYIMQPQKQYCWVMLNLKESDYPETELFQMYHEDGFGCPIFRGNEICLKKAKEFIDYYLCN